jgi:hypothetical protein
MPGEAEFTRRLRRKSWRVQIALTVPVATLWSVEAWLLSPFLALVAVVFWSYAVYLVWTRPQGMDGRTFEPVWYRSAPKRRRWPPKAYEDVGALTIGRGRVTFVGRRVKIVLNQPTVVGVGRQGVDTFNRWVEVVANDGHRALLADGTRWGWRGAYGGNDRLAAAIHEAQRL